MIDYLQKYPLSHKLKGPIASIPIYPKQASLHVAKHNLYVLLPPPPPPHTHTHIYICVVRRGNYMT